MKRRSHFIVCFLIMLVFYLEFSTTSAAEIIPENASILLESTAPHKALSIMTNVVSLDTSKYNSTPTRYSTDLFQDTLTRENIHCTFISEGSKIDALCTFINGSLQMIDILDNQGQAHLNILATGAVEYAQILLSNYQVESKDSLYGQLSLTLSGIDAKKDTIVIVGNLKLQVSALEDDTTFRWTYIENGLEAPDKCVALRYKDGFLKYFVNNWNLYKIGSASVNLSEKEAIDLAMSAAKNFAPYANSEDAAFRNLRYNVSNAMIIETVFSPSLYVDVDKVRNSDLLELYPLRHVWVSLDKFYPGNVYGINVYIWADTKEVCYFHERISTMDPPVELIADWTNSEKNPLLNNVLVEPYFLVIIVVSCGFPIVILFTLTNNRRIRRLTDWRKPSFLNLSIVFFYILLSSSVWVGLSAQPVQAEPYYGRATVWGSESQGSWNSTISSSWRKQFNNETIWQRNTSQYIANMFQLNGYSSTNNQGANNTTSDKSAILDQISSNEANYHRVAVIDFDHGNGRNETNIIGAEGNEFHYLFEDNWGTVEGTWQYNSSSANANYHAVFDDDVYSRTTGKAFFVLINACNSANINATFGNSKYNYSSTQGLIDMGESDERARGMPFAWTHKLVGTNSSSQPTGNMSADGYRYPDGNQNCYIGFDGGSAALQQPIGGTEWPYYYFIYHFFYWALTEDYTIHQALDQASKDAFQGKDFDQTLLYNGTGFNSIWPMHPNGTWLYDTSFIGYMKVYGNANLKLYQPLVTVNAYDNYNNPVATQVYIDDTYTGWAGSSFRVTPGTHTFRVTSYPDAYHSFSYFGGYQAGQNPITVSVSSDTTLWAYYQYNQPPTYFTISASSDAYSSISPSGQVSVSQAASQGFSMSASTGYHITHVYVDSVDQGAISSYTFNNVQSNHAISVTSAINTYTITPSAGSGGSINPSTPQTINYGSNSPTFYITANSGYHITDVVVDSTTHLGAVSSYQFTYVTASHAIAAYFEQDQSSTIFQDDFESGDFNAWSWNTSSVTVQSSIKHHGTYAMSYTGAANVFVAKDLGTTYSTLYIREYVYVQSFPDVWNPFSVLCTLDASYGTGASVGVYNDGGTQKFAVFGPSSNAVSSITASANTWYCLELKRVSGTGSGQLVLYVNGQQACSLSSQTLNPTRYVYAGSIWSGTSCTACVDCFAISASYIGPESGSSYVFGNGFEESAFGAWDWTYGSPSRQSSIVHDGSYAMSYTGTEVYAAKGLGTTYSTLYVREYVYLQSFPSQWDLFSVLCTRDASYGTGADVGIYNDGGTQKFALSTSSGWLTSSFTVSANTWYCIELRVVFGSGNGVAQLFVNGSSVLSSSTETINPVRYVYAGSIWSGTSCSACIDSFAANTSYIGT
jgi:hypothetical protein